MIAVESFKKFNRKDAIAILILLNLFFIFNIILSFLKNNYSFLISGIILTTFIGLTTLIVRKFGSVLIFNILISIISYLSNFNLDAISILGINNLIVLIIMSAIFEGLFLFLKLELKNIPIDMILCSAFAMASIPLSIGLLYSVEITKNMISNMINSILLYLLIGASGAIIAFLIWDAIKNNKTILKFEFSH